MSAPTGARWQPYALGWIRHGVACSSCHAFTHDPATFGWYRFRDPSGFVISRCRHCARVALGTSAESPFGRTVVPSRRRVAEDADHGEALDFRGPDPEVPRHVLEGPSEQDLGPKGCAPFC